jgi:hypothetical protein
MHPDVPDEILSRLRPICLGLAKSREETAWVGVRWKIRTKTFAHVLMIDRGWPPAYAKAAGTAGPCCVLTFRSPLPVIDDAIFRAAPFFKPVWWPDIVGMKLADGADWNDVSKLIQASYRMLAPKQQAVRKVLG